VSKASLIEHELRSLQKELDVLSLVISKGRQVPLDEIEVRGAALSLASLYNGMEKVLTQILSDRNETLGESPNWHAELLQRSHTLGVVTAKTVQDLKGFLSFRHFVRHAYSFEIDPQAIDAILDAAPDVVKRFITEVRAFLGYEG
jgi:uncharacterized protein YutE (UPF0331/DUF86 family)